MKLTFIAALIVAMAFAVAIGVSAALLLWRAPAEKQYTVVKTPPEENSGPWRKTK